MKYIKYVSIKREKGCFLCKAWNENKDDENLVIHRERRTFIIMNKFPYNTGHLLIAPARHVSLLEDLTNEELIELSKLTRDSIKLLKNCLKPEGFNIGINIGKVSGAGLEEHLHVHVVPRWYGDTNYMPIIANTKVIPEAIYDTFKKLKRCAKKVFFF